MKRVFSIDVVLRKQVVRRCHCLELNRVAGLVPHKRAPLFTRRAGEPDVRLELKVHTLGGEALNEAVEVVDGQSQAKVRDRDRVTVHSVRRRLSTVAVNNVAD